MRSYQGDDDGRVYEDDGVRDDDKRWALNTATVKALATLLIAREVVATLEQQARDYG